jgi:nucleotide-binding universal stress UspA family protein
VAREVLREAQVSVLLLAGTSRSPFDEADGAGMSVVVPLDGSATGAASALAVAGLLAQRWAAQVILLRAVGGPSAHALGPDDPALYARVALASAPARDEAMAQLESLRSRALAQDIAAWTGIVAGDLYDQTAHFARTAADLVLICLHGEGRQRAHVGEGALRVLRASGVPVLLVPQRIGLVAGEGSVH